MLGGMIGTEAATGRACRVVKHGCEPTAWSALAAFWLGGFVLASVGWWWFQRTRVGFADVL